MTIKDRVKNGNLELLYTNRICALDNNPLSIELKFDSSNTLTLIFNFLYDEGERSAEFHPLKDKETTLEFNLKNFGSPFGTFTKGPIRIGEVNKNPLKITFGVTKLNDALYMELNKDEQNK